MSDELRIGNKWTPERADFRFLRVVRWLLWEVPEPSKWFVRHTLTWHLAGSDHGRGPVSLPHSPKRCTRLCRHTVISVLPAFVEERYMEDPAAWSDEWPENPPIYEAADM